MLLLDVCKIVCIAPFPLPRRILGLISFRFKHHYFSLINVHLIDLYLCKMIFKAFRCLFSLFRELEINFMSSALEGCTCLFMYKTLWLLLLASISIYYDIPHHFRYLCGSITIASKTELYLKMFPYLKTASQNKYS